MTQIKFGTDGWRAVIAEDFTFANVARVAQATADYWKSEIRNPKSEIFGREPKVIVGYDRRFFSDRFARTTAEVFAGNGFSSGSDIRTDADAVGFLRGQTSARGRRRDDHRQPQSAEFQRLQTEVLLRRLQRFGHLPGGRKFSRPQPGQIHPAGRGRQIAGRIKIADVRPGALCRAEKTGGLQTHREIKAAFRP